VKTNPGRFFEDFRLGETIRHATPRTVTTGDVALYTGLYGPRFAVQSSDAFARALGYPKSPLDDLLTFHVVFGKTVPDVSLNALANLGYAEGGFRRPVYPGETLSTVSEVIGLKESSNRQTGVVYVRSVGSDEHGETVLSYCRWVLVRKRDPEAVIAEEHVPTLAKAVDPKDLAGALPPLNPAAYDVALAGSPHRFADYQAGERIDHVDGMTVEEAEHQIATRLFQNTAKVHFDGLAAKDTRFGRRLIYGGHVISLARALSYNGLGNAFALAGINAGRHVGPLFAGDTVYAWSEVVETADVGREDVGLLRLRTVATKNQPCAAFPDKFNDGYDPAVILDLDYWAFVPK